MNKIVLMCAIIKTMIAIIYPIEYNGCRGKQRGRIAVCQAAGKGCFAKKGTDDAESKQNGRA